MKLLVSFRCLLIVMCSIGSEAFNSSITKHKTAFTTFRGQTDPSESLHITHPVTTRSSVELKLLPDPSIIEGLVNTVSLPSLTLADPMMLFAYTKPTPLVEAEILNNIAHLALDLFGFLTPERFLLRASALLGRLMLMAADYVPDEKITTDELIFQCGMLGLTTKQLLSSWKKMVGAPQNYRDISFRDRVVYQVLFSPVGVSWLQFRSLVASCIDWVDFAPQEALRTTNEEGELIAYWLYNGKVAVKHESDAYMTQIMHRRRGKPVSEKGDVSVKSKKRDFGILADHGAFSALVEYDSDESDVVASSLLVAGETGATVLRINVTCLRDLMDDDENLDKTIRNLILLSMRSKIQALFSAVNQTAVASA